ncbi:hypothetical protein E2986_11651 [Frieseomelitta varia]|uniref:Chitin-binding type-4 domain-containing protein n=1 Tax=Frieseomelitta varia TaxID=561572 RepID=A0A833VNG1_9HYME|nr:uncharacterized protein LOC122530896 [Frieseomelitta varia]XP_043514212.1 uncharacterized protein LOC122530896 [Frieseomelitta varia]KAF3425741.1 hypothetical protein E2986_11651 [Frieseomelitta varia]
MSFVKLLLNICLLGTFLQEIHGQGMMITPVSRSSAWRFGFPVEQNFNDDDVSCGGDTQFFQNHGKCGECGDDYAAVRPRPNENGGIYGTGVIVKKSNFTMKVKVKLTTNNLGTFKFHVCPLNQTNSLETEECFNKYPIILSDYDNLLSYMYQIPNFQTTFNIEIQLPRISCKHCVFRWTYETTRDLYGRQRIFRNCADITIV